MKIESLYDILGAIKLKQIGISIIFSTDKKRVLSQYHQSLLNSPCQQAGRFSIKNIGYVKKLSQNRLAEPKKE